MQQNSVTLKIVIHGQAISIIVPFETTLRKLQGILIDNNLLKNVVADKAAFIFNKKYYSRDDFDTCPWKNAQDGQTQEVTYLLNQEVEVWNQKNNNSQKKNIQDSDEEFLPPFEQVEQLKQGECQIQLIIFLDLFDFALLPSETLADLLKFLLDNNKVGVQNDYAFKNMHTNEVLTNLQLRIEQLEIKDVKTKLKFLTQEEIDEFRGPIKFVQIQPVQTQLQQVGQKISYIIKIKDGDRTEQLEMEFTNTYTIDQIREILYKHYKYEPSITGLDLFYNRMNLQDIVKRGRTVSELNIPNGSTIDVHVRWIGGNQ